MTKLHLTGLTLTCLTNIADWSDKTVSMVKESYLNHMERYHVGESNVELILLFTTVVLLVDKFATVNTYNFLCLVLLALFVLHLSNDKLLR